MNDSDNSPLNPVFDNRIMETCPDCDGKGTINVSDCCGAEPSGNGDNDLSDFGICSDCGDYCEYGVRCETCNGTGEVEVNKQDLQDSAGEDKYQSMKEDQ